MTKRRILLAILIGIYGCKTPTEVVDYFGQAEPSTTPLRFAEGIVSKKGRFEHGISFSPNTRELAFGILDKEGITGNILYSKKIDGKWNKLEDFRPLKDKSVFLPYFTPDGKSMLYTQSISDPNRSYITNIWKLEKVNGHWGSPQRMQSPLSSQSREANASMTVDGTIYFSSNRNCDGKENCYTADLFYSERTNGGYPMVKEISELNSENDEESVFISPKEDYIIFCSYTDNTTWMDLYISYRSSDGKWTKPEIVDKTINSKDWDRRPFVSFDNNFLFFTRLEIAQQGLKESDIYWVKTSKLFKPFVYHPISTYTVEKGKQFEIALPVDYFKDINDDRLQISLKDKFDWLTFDSKRMVLSGFANFEGDVALTFRAVDGSANYTEGKITLTVSK